MQILFITSSRVGDAILTTGILKYLVDHYKTAKFTIACGPVAKGLFDNVPGLEAIITMRKGFFIRTLAKIVLFNFSKKVGFGCRFARFSNSLVFTCKKTGDIQKEE